MTGDHEAPDPLLAELAGTLRRVEPVPADVVRQARGAFAWRDISASMAALEYDSSVDDDGLSRVRAAGRERMLTFRYDDTVINLALVDGGRRMIGQITPPIFARVEVRQVAGTTTADVDELGRFLVERPVRGSVSLRCTMTRERSRDLVTEWVTI